MSTVYQKLSIVYIPHSKGETQTRIYEIYTDIRNINKAAILNISKVINFLHIKRLMLLRLTIGLLCSGLKS